MSHIDATNLRLSARTGVDPVAGETYIDGEGDLVLVVKDATGAPVGVALVYTHECGDKEVTLPCYTCEVVRPLTPISIKITIEAV